MCEMTFDPHGSRWDEYAQKGLPPEVARANMTAILQHFVECGWGGCYLGLFDKLIKPHLDDVSVLRAFLCSSGIQEKGDTERGAQGELIFYDLFKYLMNVDSAAIREYLRIAFPGFASRFITAPLTMESIKHIEILMQGADAWAEWRKRNPEVRPDLKGEKLGGAKLYKADLSGAMLWGADLSMAMLAEADLRGADLTEANLSGAQLWRANLFGATCSKAKLDGAKLAETLIAEADLMKVDLTEANLRGAYLMESNLIEAIMVRALLEGAHLSGAELIKANLFGAKLNNAILRGANLFGANLGEADLRGADLFGANLDDADMTGVIR